MILLKIKLCLEKKNEYSNETICAYLVFFSKSNNKTETNKNSYNWYLMNILQ